MVCTGEPPSVVTPFFGTLTERVEAVENELSTLKAVVEDRLLEKRAEDSEAEVKAMQATLDRAMEEIKRLKAEANEREWHNAEHDKEMWKVMELIAGDDNREAIRGREYQLTDKGRAEMASRGLLK